MRKDIDTSKPHSGRVYDFVLGGTQNFEADRKVAEGLLKIFPSFPAQARLNRWFLQTVASRWAGEGHIRVLDLGSGLPTQGHFNDYVPPEGRVLFSDHDALTVEYGADILKDKPNMRYVQADLRNPEPLLEDARKFFGEDRKLAVGMFGISYFLTAEELSHLCQTLHDFCSPGSVLAVSFVVANAAPD